MGFVKRLLAEQEASGFVTRRYFDDVCALCVHDNALRLFVSRQGVVGACDFCGSVDVHGMRLVDLLAYMANCIAAEWDDPVNEVGWDRGWDASICVYDSDDLLDLLDEPLTNRRLRLAFVEAFDHQWCQRSPYRLEHSHMLKLSWEHFAHLVRTRHRYLFLADRGTCNDELVPPARMLGVVAQAIHNTPWRMLQRIPAGTALFRARAHDCADRPSDASGLGSPPPTLARPNRMSPAGISMFYGAEDSELAAAEVRAGPADTVTTGRWTTTRDIWCLDLTNAVPVPSLFDMTARTVRPWLRFLAHFAAELSKPADAATADVDYVPTQIVTEYVRDILRSTTTDEPIEAIVYTSAVSPGKTCWVVFAGPELCGNKEDDAAGRLLLLERSTVSRTTAPPSSSEPS